MSYVLAIEPDQAQAQILRDDVSARAKATITVVASLADGIAAIDHAVPDLVLVSPLMPSDDERMLLERLRDLTDQPVPQILVTPALAPLDGPRHAKRPLFSRRRRRALPIPCDPYAFADDLSAYLPDARPRTARIVPMPTRAAAAERRESARFERIDLARVLLDGAAVDVVDVSLSGAQVLAPRVLRPGTFVHVLLARRAEALCCDAGVVWSGIDIAAAGHDVAFRAGIKFSGLDRLALERLYFGDSRFAGPVGRFLKGSINGDTEQRPGR